MKIIGKFFVLFIVSALTFCCFFSACAVNGDIIEEDFFMSMTNIQQYPKNYSDIDIRYDCFTYKLTDINGQDHLCGVRQCSSGFGCTCGNDTIIGFLLEYDGEIPEPRNQSEKSVEKTWVHIEGRLKDTELREIQIYAYTDGKIDYQKKPETVKFLVLTVSEINLINDYQNLKYYVTK
ncbi:MAG: hypothetical protein J5911_03930 [Clostridia bacterium]|nr:hypothetical protein [Clostridia bacterium]